jgi:hypothetical protein
VAVLDHHGECIGRWTLNPAGGVVACRVCRREYPSTPERRFAAAYDVILTGHMHRLATAGAALLAAERRRFASE